MDSALDYPSGTRSKLISLVKPFCVLYGSHDTSTSSIHDIWGISRKHMATRLTTEANTIGVFDACDKRQFWQHVFSRPAKILKTYDGRHTVASCNATLLYSPHWHASAMHGSKMFLHHFFFQRPVWSFYSLSFLLTTKCRMPWSLWISSSESEGLSHDFNLLAFLHLWDLLLRFIPKSHC